jgi:hypothetical protein
MNKIRYELYAENHRDKTLIIKNLEQDNYFVCTATEIFNDAKLLEGFSNKDISFIRTAIESASPV